MRMLRELDMRGNYHSFVVLDMKSLRRSGINHRPMLNDHKVSLW
jgi:hypothetical protein